MASASAASVSGGSASGSGSGSAWAAGTVGAVETQKDLEAVPSSGQLWVLLFGADWFPGTADKGDVIVAFERLAADNPSVRFAKVDAETADEVSLAFGITVVPTTVFLKGTSLLAKVEGADTSPLAGLVAKFSSTAGASTPAESGPSTASAADAAAADAALETRLKSLISAAPVMVFMKGSPSEPRCKFSRAMMEILSEVDAKFGSFDILTDDAVRQGLKKLSDWPTYPQVYVDGKLLGGLDIIKELKEEGDLKDALTPATTAKSEPTHMTGEDPKVALQARLKELISSQPIMLFMKGVPSAPRCGFSRQMIEILNGVGVSYGTFDILSDNDVRQGLKEFSNWPTYPQLYVKGELVGGLDIVKELQSEGELKDTLSA